MEELETLLSQAPLAVRGGLASKEGKTCVLMQAYIAGLPVKAFALVSDCTFIAQSAARSEAPRRIELPTGAAFQAAVAVVVVPRLPSPTGRGHRQHGRASRDAPCAI